MLVFEDNVVLNEHYSFVHREKKITQVVFGFSLQDQDEEETKMPSKVSRNIPYRYEEESKD